jgi:DNA-binding IclR family transcriptional regulator
MSNTTDGRSVTFKLAAILRTFSNGASTRVATARQELRLNTAAVAVPVFASGGNVVAALELTTTGMGTQLHFVQSAVVVAARALSRDLVASQCRSREYRSAPSVVNS